MYATSLGRDSGYVTQASVVVVPTSVDVGILAYPADGRAHRGDSLPRGGHQLRQRRDHVHAAAGRAARWGTPARAGHTETLHGKRGAQVDGFDARVAASLERVVPCELLPIAVSPDMVRIKQRKRFFLASLGVAQCQLSFWLNGTGSPQQSEWKKREIDQRVDTLLKRQRKKEKSGQKKSTTKNIVHGSAGMKW